MNEVVLDDSDPTVFAKCPKCCASYTGKVQGDYFAKAYPRRKWGRIIRCPDCNQAHAQVCENCHTDMQFIYEVK